MGIIGKYWRGGYSLGASFWFGFVLLAAGYHYLEPVLLAPFADQPALYTTVAVAYVAVCRLIVFPWQVVGLLKASDRHYLAYGRAWVRYGVQAVIVLGLAFTAAHVIGSVQSLLIYKDMKEFLAESENRDYSVVVLDDGRTIRLSGPLDFGITKTVEDFLAGHPRINSIVLESEGGQIYEGRGLAMLIEKYGLDTYTFESCSSACTTAFIGGEKRYLGTGARLGFHRYRMDSAKTLQYHKYYDMDVEHTKDMDLFRKKRIKAAFLDRVFETPHDRIWFPDAETLIDAGVITGLVDGG